jgi:hypothetical protein
MLLSIPGLRDYSPFLALHTNLNFYKTIGPENIFKRMLTLASEAG